MRDDADRGEAERTNREMALAKRVRRRTGVLLVVIGLIAAGGVTTWLTHAVPTCRRLRSSARRPRSKEARRVIRTSPAGASATDHDFEAVELITVSNPADEISAARRRRRRPDRRAFDLFDEVHDVAAAHPDTWFIAMSGTPLDIGLPNVTTVYPSDDGPARSSAGAAAALTSTTGRVGYLGAHQPINEPFRSGFEAGCKRSTPTIEMISTYLVQTGHGRVPATGGRSGRRLGACTTQGADVVFHAAGDSGNLVPRWPTR